MSAIVKDSNGQLVSTVFKPGTTQVFSVTTSSVQSNAFGSTTTVVLVTCSQGHGHIQFGTNPTATTTSSIVVPTGHSMMFAVNPGDKAAVIRDAGIPNCTIGITELL